jgi:hypothetical protein
VEGESSLANLTTQQQTLLLALANAKTNAGNNSWLNGQLQKIQSSTYKCIGGVDCPQLNSTSLDIVGPTSVEPSLTDSYLTASSASNINPFDPSRVYTGVEIPIAPPGATPPFNPDLTNPFNPARLYKDQNILLNGSTSPVTPVSSVTPVAKSPVAKGPFVYISPLVKTEIPGYDDIPEPYGEVNFGKNGHLYDPKLDFNDGVMYLKRYLANNEDESFNTAKGGEWRFQYAPADNKWAREATYQQDATWSSNQQPYHFKNVSGKVFEFNNVIMEGVTLGKSLDGAIKSLERMLCVNNAAETPQYSPFAFRLIVAGKTYSDPVTGIHIPFVLTQLSVIEEAYDLNGRLIECTINLTMREVPAYQVNYGRKLNLIAAQVGLTPESDKCPGLLREYNKLLTQMKGTRDYFEQLQKDRFGDGADYNPSNISEAEKKTLESNCTKQAADYIQLKKLAAEIAKICPGAKGINLAEPKIIYDEPYQNPGGLFGDAENVTLPIVQQANLEPASDILFPASCKKLDDPRATAPQVEGNKNCYSLSKDNLVSGQKCTGCSVPIFPGNLFSSYSQCANNIISYWNSEKVNITQNKNSSGQQKELQILDYGDRIGTEIRDFQNLQKAIIKSNITATVTTDPWVNFNYKSCESLSPNTTVNTCQQYVAYGEIISALNKLAGISTAAATK